MRIHVYPRHLPPPGTPVTHLVVTGIGPRDTLDAMRRLLRRYDWTEAWFRHARQPVDGFGQLFKVELLVREKKGVDTGQ